MMRRLFVLGAVCIGIACLGGYARSEGGDASLALSWLAAPSSTGKVEHARFFHIDRMMRVDLKGDTAVLWLTGKLRSSVAGAVKEQIEEAIRASAHWLPSLSSPGRYINLKRVGWIQASESEEIARCKPERCLVHLVYDEGSLEKLHVDLTKVPAHSDGEPR
ncbi:hypothetical protein [Candidatus Nitrospira bockiana]